MNAPTRFPEEPVFAGGAFTKIGTEPRVRLAALEKVYGLALSWSPTPSNDPITLAATNDVLDVGGYFATIDGHQQSGLATFDFSSSAVTEVAADMPSGNDMRVALSSGSTGFVQLVLAAPGKVTLEAFDLEGRRVDTMLRGALEPAGTTSVRLDWRRRPPGVYFLRLTTEKGRVSRRAILLR